MPDPTHLPIAGEPPLVVVMGVSGSGKSTVGAALAERLGVPFADADNFHPPANVAKMSTGVPLEDADRVAWIEVLGAWLAARGAGGVLSCSALRRAHRDRLRAHAPGTAFLHLHGSREVLRRRLTARVGHFMPAELLDSQLAALQPLGPDERGLVVDVEADVGAIVSAFLD